MKFLVRFNRRTLADSTPADLGIKYMEISSVRSDGGQEKPQELLFDAAPSRARRLAKAGDTVISTVRTYLKAITYVDESASDRVWSTGFAVLEPGPRLEPRFLYHVARSAPFVAEITRRSVGVSYPAVNPDDIGDIVIPVPPRQEQRRIAAFLDEEEAGMDRLLKAKSTFRGLLEEKRLMLRAELPLRGVADVPLRPSGLPTIGPIPQHWSVQQNKTLIREVAELSTSGGEELLTVSHITGVTPRAEKDVNMFLASSLEGYKRCRPGDLVVNTMWAWMGALGVSQHEGIVSPAYGVYRLDRTRMLPEYYDLLYRTPAYVAEMTRFSKGIWSSRLRLYPEAFLSLKTLVPPLEEQRSIVDAVRGAEEPIEVLVSKLSESTRFLEERRQALVTDSVAGRVVPGKSPPSVSGVAA